MTRLSKEQTDELVLMRELAKATAAMLRSPKVQSLPLARNSIDLLAEGIDAFIANHGYQPKKGKP